MHATRDKALGDGDRVDLEELGQVDGVFEEIGVDQQRDGLLGGQSRTRGQSATSPATLDELEARADELELLLDVGELEDLDLGLVQEVGQRVKVVGVVGPLGASADGEVAALDVHPVRPRDRLDDPGVLRVHQPQGVEAGEVALGLALQALGVEHLRAEAHAALVHDVGRLAVVLLHHVEGVEEVVVVVVREVDGAGAGLHDGLEVLEEVDVGVGGQLAELLPLEEGHDELAEVVLAAGVVGVRDHGVVGLVVVAELQVVREQDVA